MKPTVSADLRPLQNIRGGNVTQRYTVKWRETEMESEADKASEQQEFVGGTK